MSLRLSAAVLSVTIATAALAKSDVPKGWFLHDDLVPTLTLAYYDPSSGAVNFSVTCTAGYADAIVAFYPESNVSNEKKPVRLVLSRGTGSLSIDATGQMYNGRYTIDGQTSMEQRLVELLQGGFTLSADGQEMKTFSTTEHDSVHVRKLTEACRG